MKTILFLDNTAWGLYNFRLSLIQHYLHLGYKIVVAIPYDSTYFSKFTKLNCTVCKINLDSRGINPISDIYLLIQYYKLIKKVKPSILISYTIKPNIYGGFISSRLRVPYLPVVPGAGTVFQNTNLITRIVQLLYRTSFKKASKVFFLNEEDLGLFVQKKLVSDNQAYLLPGEGINLDDFNSGISYTKERHPFTFILVARLLKAKGIIYYHDAAKMLKTKYPEIKFFLLGMLAPNNPDAIAQKTLDNWNEEGVIDYLGASNDVSSILSKTDCLVLPSYYREGVPRSLMEGAAMGLPLITTNQVGCREVVVDGYNGFLCKVKDSKDLFLQMEKVYMMNPKERLEMGMKGRMLMHKKFDVQIIIRAYDRVLKDIL